MKTAKDLRWQAAKFIVSVSLPDGVSAADLEWAVVQLLALPSIMCERESGNKRKLIDLRPGIESVRIVSGDDSGTQMVMRLPHREFTVKPVEVVQALNRFTAGISLISLHRSELIVAQRII